MDTKINDIRKIAQQHRFGIRKTLTSLPPYSFMALCLSKETNLYETYILLYRCEKVMWLWRKSISPLLPPPPTPPNTKKCCLSVLVYTYTSLAPERLDVFYSYSVIRNLSTGCSITQAVIHRLPTAGARIRSHVRSCGIRGEQSDTGAGYRRVLRLLLPILIPPTAPQSSSSSSLSSSGAGTVGQ
jgi:hypothetical protein